ncbi:MAG: GDP-L-fucose synthase [Proteobacteria bacterium]|nr:GDP-L-fucose synthase [Pseudomonadota bacterium]
MNKNSRIYVAGHTGLIGSALLRLLKREGCSHILTRTHTGLDLTNQKAVDRFFTKEKPQYVFLAAARVGGIHANKTYPAEFIYQNLMIQTNVIDCALKYKAKKLLLLSSSCIYPIKSPQPMKEAVLFSGDIEETNDAFGMAKLTGIKMCQAYHRQYGANFISVIPANVYGPGDHFDENGHVLAALIEKFHQAHQRNKKWVTLWGTGKPKREFLYVEDAAEGCVFLMKKYHQPDPINLGIGRETSITQLARLVQSTVGFRGQLKFDTAKPDGNLRRLLDSRKIHALGWRAGVSLENGLQRTYDWYRKHLDGKVK